LEFKWHFVFHQDPGIVNESGGLAEVGSARLSCEGELARRWPIPVDHIEIERTLVALLILQLQPLLKRLNARVIVGVFFVLFRDDHLYLVLLPWQFGYVLDLEGGRPGLETLPLAGKDAVGDESWFLIGQESDGNNTLEGLYSPRRLRRPHQVGLRLMDVIAVVP